MHERLPQFGRSSCEVQKLIFIPHAQRIAPSSNKMMSNSFQLCHKSTECQNCVQRERDSTGTASLNATAGGTHTTHRGTSGVFGNCTSKTVVSPTSDGGSFGLGALNQSARRV